MNSELIVAVLSLVGTFFGSFSGIRLICYRIEQLEKKVEKHNSVVERMAVMEDKMENASRRIGALERNMER